jgi:hypothetical protein
MKPVPLRVRRRINLPTHTACVHCNHDLYLARAEQFRELEGNRITTRAGVSCPECGFWQTIDLGTQQIQSRTAVRTPSDRLVSLTLPGPLEVTGPPQCECCGLSLSGLKAKSLHCPEVTCPKCGRKNVLFLLMGNLVFTYHQPYRYRRPRVRRNHDLGTGGFAPSGGSSVLRWLWEASPTHGGPTP